MPKSPSSQMKILSIIEQRTKRRDSLACLRRGSHLKPLPPLYISSTSLQHPNQCLQIHSGQVYQIHKIGTNLKSALDFSQASLFVSEWNNNLLTTHHREAQYTAKYNKSAPHNASHWFRNQRQLSADCLSLGVQPEASGCAVLCKDVRTEPTFWWRYRKDLVRIPNK